MVKFNNIRTLNPTSEFRWMGWIEGVHIVEFNFFLSKVYNIDDWPEIRHRALARCMTPQQLGFS